MSHAHIPTLPQIHRPKHKRLVPPDSPTAALCSGCSTTSMTLIVRTGCPRHDPVYYTAALARHATDSL